MAYNKRTWDNVPDPSTYEGDLNSLPRFDKDNMNRIEQGIHDAHILINTKAPDGHGLGGTVGKTKYASFLNTMLKGCGFYEMGTSDGSPLTTDEWLAMLQLSRDITEGEQTGTQLAFYDFDPNNPRMWLRTILKGVEGDWAEMIHTGNITGYSNKIVTGTYTGDGAESQFINLGFTPDAVLIMPTTGLGIINRGGYDGEYRSGLATKTMPCRVKYFEVDQPIITVVENGFYVYYSEYHKNSNSEVIVSTNEDDALFNYIAIRKGINL